MDRLVGNRGILLEAARLLGVPVVASEQYPRGLGPTVAPLAEKLRALGVTPIDKMTFDACGEPRVARALAERDATRRRRRWGWRRTCACSRRRASSSRRGLDVHVVADAVASRREENRALGLALCERAGACATPTETVVFDWLERAGSDAFKAVSKLVR